MGHAQSLYKCESGSAHVFVSFAWDARLSMKCFNTQSVIRWLPLIYMLRYESCATVFDVVQLSAQLRIQKWRDFP